jgi:hypothetical protein
MVSPGQGSPTQQTSWAGQGLDSRIFHTSFHSAPEFIRYQKLLEINVGELTRRPLSLRGFPLLGNPPTSADGSVECW